MGLINLVFGNLEYLPQKRKLAEVHNHFLFLHLAAVHTSPGHLKTFLMMLCFKSSAMRSHRGRCAGKMIKDIDPVFILNFTYLPGIFSSPF